MAPAGGCRGIPIILCHKKVLVALLQAGMGTDQFFFIRFNSNSETFDSTQLMTHNGFTRIDLNQYTTQNGFLEFDSTPLTTRNVRPGGGQLVSGPKCLLPENEIGPLFFFFLGGGGVGAHSPYDRSYSNLFLFYFPLRGAWPPCPSLGYVTAQLLMTEKPSRILIQINSRLKTLFRILIRINS